MRTRLSSLQNWHLPHSLALFWMLFVALAACTRGQIAQTTDDGWTPSGPVDFAYEINGKKARISDLRGRPLVLVLMRTSELPSQVQVGAVRQAFVETAGVVQFLVLTIEQREAPFVGPYVESEKLPFPIGIAEPDVAVGLSPLGLIPVIPVIYLIDAQGRIYDAAAGVVPADRLIEAIQHFDKR